MAPTHTPLSNTISARQSTSDQSDNDHSIPVAAAIAPIIIGIAVFFFICAFCLRRRSRYAATQNAAMTTSSSINYFPLRRYNNGGVARNDDTQNGEEGPPAYTSIPVPPPAYTPDQPPSNRTRANSDGNREQVHAGNNNGTSTRRYSEAPEEGKGPEHATWEVQDSCCMVDCLPSNVWWVWWCV